VKRVGGLFPPLKTLRGSKGLRLNEIGQQKKANAMDVGRTRGCHIARNARCLPARLREGSRSVVNVKSIPAMIWHSFNPQCLIGSNFGTTLNESNLLGINNGSKKLGDIMRALDAKPLIPHTT